ncbi:MAG TPA: DNA alkylation repair protein [Anaerolineales bacterium]|jgi:3-methyladenine DNA glycosylase AlkD|nr:DNA alkylation repair protein [Anaerolineales bacterium]
MTKTTKLTAIEFLKRLKAKASSSERKKYERYFPDSYKEFIGVRMGMVFALAKDFIDMPVAEIDKLLESKVHEARAGAMSIMGKSASGKKVTPERLKELYDLYIRRHDRINTWDLVDLAAYHVVGRYLEDKPRKILYRLAKSKEWAERRTAIVATAHFIRSGEVEETYKIAELLFKDPEDLVHKGAGWMLRYAGDVDRKRLLAWLDKHAAKMPRVMLRYTIEKLDKKQRERYLSMGK